MYQVLVGLITFKGETKAELENKLRRSPFILNDAMLRSTMARAVEIQPTPEPESSNPLEQAFQHVGREFEQAAEQFTWTKAETEQRPVQPDTTTPPANGTTDPGPTEPTGDQGQSYQPYEATQPSFFAEYRWPILIGAGALGVVAVLTLSRK